MAEELPNNGALRTETEKGTNVGTYDAAVRTEDEKEITEKITATIPLVLGVGSADLKGVGAVIATSAMAFSQTSDLKGAGKLDGSAALALAETADLKGAGVLSSTVNTVFDSTADLGGVAELTGTSALAFTPTSADLAKKSPFEIVASSNIAASGENTTNRLSTTVNPFGGGRIQDDENPADAVDLGADESGEWAWAIKPSDVVVWTVQYSFRLVLADGTPFDTYDQVPKWTVTSGSIEGTSTLVFDSTANLKGSAPISGTIPLIFGVSSAYLTGSGPLDGTSAITFGETADLKGEGALAGTSALAITEAADLQATGALAGSSSLVFGESADLKGEGTLSGLAEMVFEASTSLAATGALAGSSNLVFDLGANELRGSGALAGSSALAFDSNAFGSVYNPITGSASMTFSESADLKGEGALVASEPIVFGIDSALLAGEGDLAGTSSIVFDSITDLRNLSMRNLFDHLIGKFDTRDAYLQGKSDSSARIPMTFGQTADLKASGVLAGTSDITFDSSFDLVGDGILAGSSSLVFGADADLKASGILSGSTQLEFLVGADLKGQGDLASTVPMTISIDSADLGGRGVLEGSPGMVFDQTANLAATGDLFGTADQVFGHGADLKASGILAGTTGMDFDSAADIFGFVMTGSASLAFGSSSDLKGEGILSGSIPMVFGSIVDLDGRAYATSTVALAFDTSGDLAGVGDLLAEVALTFGVSVADLLNISLYIRCTLVDRQGRGLPRLDDLSWAWFDDVDPVLFTTPTDQGQIESTDGAAVIQIPLPGSSLDGGVGTLILRSDNGELLGAYNMTTQY